MLKKFEVTNVHSVDFEGRWTERVADVELVYGDKKAISTKDTHMEVFMPLHYQYEPTPVFRVTIEINSQLPIRYFHQHGGKLRTDSWVLELEGTFIAGWRKFDFLESWSNPPLP